MSRERPGTGSGRRATVTDGRREANDGRPLTDGGNDGLLYYEEVSDGRRKIHGSYTITPEEARKFAEAFDPRPDDGSSGQPE
jgi:hypothetical protein